MAFISKGGEISKLVVKKGKQKGFITKGGEVSNLIRYIPTPEVTTTGYGQDVLSVAAADMSAVLGVAKANINSVLGVE
tara:strand:- start:1061 stop:1294 length:234 start_codon:yes stop_codon:yes gene_type:complete